MAIGNENNLVDTLNNLIQLDFDAIAAYDSAISRLNDPTFQGQLRGFKGDHERHTRELAECVQMLGGKPATGGDAKKILTQGKVVIAGLGDDKSILKAMKSNEDETNEAYGNAVARSDLGAQPKVMDVLKRGLADERRHRQWLEQTLSKM